MRERKQLRARRLGRGRRLLVARRQQRARRSLLPAGRGRHLGQRHVLRDRALPVRRQRGDARCHRRPAELHDRFGLPLRHEDQVHGPHDDRRSAAERRQDVHGLRRRLRRVSPRATATARTSRTTASTARSRIRSRIKPAATTPPISRSPTTRSSRTPRTSPTTGSSPRTSRTTRCRTSRTSRR